MKFFEYNCDGLIGPSHNYCGLSYGNVASAINKNAISDPKAAAKQGLIKMKSLADMGLKQMVLPPHERPAIGALRHLGFTGTDQHILQQAAKQAPEILANVSSASAMWTANAATISPSPDTQDGKIHITTANLNDKYHRSIEINETTAILRATFKDPEVFAHHQALPGVAAFGDEGAANHTRLCRDYGDPGLHLFVYGRNGFDIEAPQPKVFPARQTLQASQAIARQHQLNDQHVIFAQQDPACIDAGVFHNDVIGVGNRNLYLYHQDAYLDKAQILDRIASHFADSPFHAIEVPRDAVSMEDAITSYLFNTQIVDIQDQRMAIIAPSECENNPRVKAYLDTLLTQDNPIQQVIFQDLRQSMRNGGGPACLRLRVVMTEQQAQAVNQGSIMTDILFQRLMTWVDKYYRDRVSPEDLADVAFLNTNREGLDELTQILQLGSIYPFQQV